MGLDLVVEGCAKPGYEAEWRRILERVFGDEEPLEEDVAHFAEICIPPYERLGAPRVGYDEAADAWIIKAADAGEPDEIARVLKEYHGYYVLRLIESDGLPQYSHGGLYKGADETSFRGAFLSECNDVLSTELWPGAPRCRESGPNRRSLSEADGREGGPALPFPTKETGVKCASI